MRWDVLSEGAANHVTLTLTPSPAHAGFHHASTSAKLQALSKRAVRRSSIPAPSTAAAAPQQQAQHKGQQLPTKKRKQHQQQQQSPEQAEEGLLDAATGAFVHGTEDDLPRVRLLLH